MLSDIRIAGGTENMANCGDVAGLTGTRGCGAGLVFLNQYRRETCEEYWRRTVGG